LPESPSTTEATTAATGGEAVYEFEAVWPLIDRVSGFLIPGQERWLFNAVSQLPGDAVIVEIGSFLGRSTTAMAFACRGTNRKIHAIDTFKGNDSDFIKGKNNVAWEGDDYFETFESNLVANDLLKHVVPHRGLSSEVGTTWSLPADFIFIDGSHEYEDVVSDFETYFPWLKPGGLIAFHDVLPGWEGPYKAWQEDVRQHLERPSHLFSIAAGRKPADVASMPGRVHAIVPAHNRVQFTRACLRQFVEQSYLEKMTITVVDDGSTDGTAEMLANEYPQVKVIKGDGNLWWTGAVAKAIDELQSEFGPDDYFLLVNNDTQLSVETVEMLVRESERLGRAGVSPIALSGSQAISTGWGPKTAPILNDFERQSAFFARSGNVIAVQSLFGRCSLFPVEILDAVRNYDAETFPHYHGDTDFCLRARRAGFQFFVTGATCVRVIDNQDTTGRHYQFRLGPQPLRKVLGNMFSRKSIDNIPANWHFLWRHSRGNAVSKSLQTVWRSLRQWAPIYNGLGLQPIDPRTSGEKRSRRSVWGFLKYYVGRCVYYLLRPAKGWKKARSRLSASPSSPTEQGANGGGHPGSGEQGERAPSPKGRSW
jgi:GT2 family glycosyltransferase